MLGCCLLFEGSPGRIVEIATVKMQTTVCYGLKSHLYFVYVGDDDRRICLNWK